MRVLLLPIGLALLLLTAGCSLFGGSEGQRGDDSSLSVGAAIDDSDLELRIRERLVDADERFSDARIKVVSHNARILITGRVPAQSMIDEATEVVRQFRRARLLHNELRVGSRPTAEMRSTDQWISVRVKGRLTLTADFPSRRVVITTQEGTVYLMGLVTREQGQIAEQNAAAVDGVQRVVSIFDYID
ncbi:MAG: BON domain-containing protein [Natronospirillum sp.]|uniref:BON domain-containing protein n=1 Tax=Natronospirillum sp. TaxID=2812955 RepID=UPI0025D8B3BA|nr:BON domain-containing protein [Natronospirillum sp.]MCH8551321.1 BON domain-containing protein [Natronospirillum sp.]